MAVKAHDDEGLIDLEKAANLAGFIVPMALRIGAGSLERSVVL